MVFTYKGFFNDETGVREDKVSPTSWNILDFLPLYLDIAQIKHTTLLCTFLFLPFSFSFFFVIPSTL
jgi:hypothetical protein